MYNEMTTNTAKHIGFLSSATKSIIMTNMSILAVVMLMIVACSEEECNRSVSAAQDITTRNKGFLTIKKFCNLYETWKKDNNIKKMTKVDFDELQIYVSEYAEFCDYEKVIAGLILADIQEDCDDSTNKEDIIEQYKEFYELFWEADVIARSHDKKNSIIDYLKKPHHSKNNGHTTVQGCLFEFVKEKRALFGRIVNELYELKNTKGDTYHDAWMYANCFNYSQYAYFDERIIYKTLSSYYCVIDQKNDLAVEK